MKILVAPQAGFCTGVKRALEMAEAATAHGKPVYTLGSLIHNEQEIRRLKEKGVAVAGCLEEIREGTPVIIRSHGVGPGVYQKLEDLACTLIDATCPHVQKAQRFAQQAVREGKQVLILGDKNHPEVQGIREWTGNSALVVSSWQDLEGMSLSDDVAVLAQTTEKEERFNELVEYLRKRVPEVTVLPTICSATRLRQKAAAELAQEVEVMIVVGGKHSSNTNKLLQVCQEYLSSCYLVEEATELNPLWFKDKSLIGVTAGASTPAWIIEEVIRKMEEIRTQNNLEKELIEAQEPKESIPQEELGVPSLQVGEVLKGTVVKVNQDEVLVDVGGKSEGILPAKEMSFKQVDPREVLTEGQEILVEVLKEDQEGNIILSRKNVYLEEAYRKLEEAQEKDEIITAPAVEVVKGGLLVDVGVRGFVPASHVDRSYVEDLSQYLQKEMRLKVIELDKEHKKAVLSQKVVLEEEYQKQKEDLLNEIEEGQVRKGVVKRLAKFGAFVDLGGIDGLLHISEMGWARVEDPSEVVKEGEEIEVYVLKVDREKEKISLGLKQLLKSPWELAQEKYKANMVIQGKVVRIAPFGAFVEVEPGLEGLVHISQISDRHVKKVEDVLTVGQMVEAKILDINFEKKRMSLSLKGIGEDAQKAEYQAYMAQYKSSGTVTIGEILQQSNEEIIEELEKK